jgi:ribosomal protein S27AE
MNESRTPIRCPKCGTSMNHHADKLVEPRTPADARDVKPELGGIVEEAHACPACGSVEARRA